MVDQIENYRKRTIFLVLSIVFFLFYLIQIPFWTDNQDVLVYSCRSTSDYPILSYAYLDERSSFLSLEEPWPNYHLGHTILLWVVYHLVPRALSKTIWPSGLLSAISGAFIVGLTFLIWSRLGLQKKEAICVGIVAGLLPTIWFHSLIGEVQSLQFCLILFFLYSYLQNNFLLSTLAFLAANLVSPLAGLCYPLILLDPLLKRKFPKAIMVGASALVIYYIIHLVLDINVLAGFGTFQPNEYSRSILWKVYKVSTYFIFNINFLIIFLLPRYLITLNRHKKKVLLLLFLSMVPHLVLSFKFITELGIFQLPIFWALSFPIGLSISSKHIPSRYVLMSFLGLVLTFLFIWMIPSIQTGKAHNQAGKWLKSNVQDELKIIGWWNCSIGVVLSRYNWNFEKLSTKYIVKEAPTTEELMKTKEKSLIIVNENYNSRIQNKIRSLLIDFGIPGIEIKGYEPEKAIQLGTVEFLFENRAVRLYRWELEKTVEFENKIVSY